MNEKQVCIHFVYVSEEGALCFRPGHGTLLHEQPECTVLCMGGVGLSKSFLKRWTQQLSSHYQTSWRSTAYYGCCGITLLVSGYLAICIPFAALLLMLWFRVPAHIIMQHATLGQHVVHGTGAVLLSAFFFRLFWAYGLKHQWFSAVENQFAFAINTRYATYFKQLRAYSMKKYAAQVPLITVARTYLPQQHILMSMVCYNIPHYNRALVVPTACEAIDVLRGMVSPTRTFCNMLVSMNHTENKEVAENLLAFFESSGFRAFITPDHKIIVCTWGNYLLQYAEHTHSCSAHATLLRLTLGSQANHHHPPIVTTTIPSEPTHKKKTWRSFFQGNRSYQPFHDEVV